MGGEWTRRDLLATVGGTLALSGLPAAADAAGSPSRAAASRRLKAPFAVGSDNALTAKRADGTTPLADCLARLERGERALAALVAGIEICELDPNDSSVGYGGLPNADGVVELDAAVMEGRSGRAGGVAALTGVRNPSRVALAVADETDHHLLVGGGAREFARQMGFTIEADLNTAVSRKAWLDWKRRVDPGHWLDPERRSDAGESARAAMIAAGELDPLHLHGTIHLSLVARDGDVACATSTSGLAFKIPGRVGDSPILGAGLHCDPAAGSAGSTGRGEANLAHLSSAWIVDEIRRGAHPKDAAMAALARVRERNVAARLRRPNGDPAFNLQFYALDLKGNFAGVSLYRDYQGSVANFAIGDASGLELVECEALLERRPKPGEQGD